MAFVGLHNHSDFSNFRLRDSINRITDLIDYSHELGHKGIAITEHETIASSLNAQKYYHKKKQEPGWEDFKLILGNEIYLCNESVNEENKIGAKYPHFILLALDEIGHEQIRELSTVAWSHSFMHVMMRVPTYYSDLEKIIGENPGHVVGSTACLGGSLPYHILQLRELEGVDFQNKFDELIQFIEYMKSIFGEGCFFLEMQPSDNEEQIYVNKQLVQLSKLTDTPYIITTDSHYLKKEDASIHKAFLDSQDGEREVDEFYATTYVMSEEEIHEYMDKYLSYDVVETGINNTMLIYDKVQDYDLCKPLEIPYVPLNTEEPCYETFLKYKDIPLLQEFFYSDTASDRHLVREIIDAIERDPEQYQNEETYQGIGECLDAIQKSSQKMNVHWSAYLVQTKDFVDLIWEKADSLVGAGRGSGVGFSLLNILGITQINPLRETTKTYPWRFLNPERASVLDIDIDVESTKRAKIIEVFKQVYGEDKVSKVMTLNTEQSKSALLTSCRGLGIDSDTASYLASLIVYERGQARTLKQMYYGDKENDIKPDATFVTEMNKYPKVWEVAQKIEGLINGVGSHAGGVILTNKPFTKVTALMKTNSGDVITQFDLHMCEDVSLIKWDLLCIEALDKIRAELELLLAAGKITYQGSLRTTYEKYIGVYTLERNAPDMWKMLWNHEVMSFFQMEKESGIQAVALGKPTSVDDLATLNSVMRLMAQEKGGEQPLHKYARFKKNIQEWYDEMTEYGLTKEEQEILKEIIGISNGICEAQEYLVLLTQHPKIGGFSLSWGDRLRRAVAKKKPKEFLQLEDEFFANAREKNLSKNLTNYVWHVLIGTQRKYGFNKSHTLAYSIIGLQELNLCYKYPIIYWNTANLIVDSGSLDVGEQRSSNYGKIATAIANMKKSGIQITLPLINEAKFEFVPDEENNRIIYSFKSLCGIGDDIARAIIENQPYASFEDFCERMVDTKIIGNAKMVILIKAGCFTQLDNSDRRETMKKFILRNIYTPIDKLTFSQFGKVSELNMIPKELSQIVKIYNFKSYVLDDYFVVREVINDGKKVPKKGYHDRIFTLDRNSQRFFLENFDTSDNGSVVGISGEYMLFSEKKFEKEWKKKIEPLREWLSELKTTDEYNRRCFEEIWTKYAEGTVSKWEMDSLSFYYGEHELSGVDEEYYGIVNFFDLPTEPEAYDYYSRFINGERKYIPKYAITRLAGTVLDSNNSRHTVALLTQYGVVNCKFNKGQYVHYNKRISARLTPGSDKKTVLEESWFKRGTKLLICGYRQDDVFRAYRYADTVYQHTAMRINEIQNDTLLIQSERREV